MGALASGSKRPAAGTGAQSGAEQKTAKRRRAKASAKASAQADSNISAGRPNAAGSEADGQTGDPSGSGDPVIEAGGQLPLLIQQQRSQRLPAKFSLSENDVFWNFLLGHVLRATTACTF